MWSLYFSQEHATLQLTNGFIVIRIWASSRTELFDSAGTSATFIPLPYFRLDDRHHRYSCCTTSCKSLLPLGRLSFPRLRKSFFRLDPGSRSPFMGVLYVTHIQIAMLDPRSSENKMCVVVSGTSSVRCCSFSCTEPCAGLQDSMTRTTPSGRFTSATFTEARKQAAYLGEFLIHFN